MRSYLSVVLFTILLPRSTIAHDGAQRIGNVRYWEENNRPGSCGYINYNNDPAVSLSNKIMHNSPNPNTNPICGREVSLLNPNTSQSITLEVIDTCANCTENDIVVSIGVFRSMAIPAQGVIKNVTWYLSEEPAQPLAAGASGSGSAEYVSTDTASATTFDDGTGAAYSTGIATGAGISSTGSILPAV